MSMREDFILRFASSIYHSFTAFIDSGGQLESACLLISREDCMITKVVSIKDYLIKEPAAKWHEVSIDKFVCVGQDGKWEIDALLINDYANDCFGE